MQYKSWENYTMFDYLSDVSFVLLSFLSLWWNPPDQKKKKNPASQRMVCLVYSSTIVGKWRQELKSHHTLVKSKERQNNSLLSFSLLASSSFMPFLMNAATHHGLIFLHQLKIKIVPVFHAHKPSPSM